MRAERFPDVVLAPLPDVILAPLELLTPPGGGDSASLERMVPAPIVRHVTLADPWRRR